MRRVHGAARRRRSSTPAWSRSARSTARDVRTVEGLGRRGTGLNDLQAASSRPAAPSAGSARRACSWPPRPPGRRRRPATRRSARRSPATSAAARATPRSSRRSRWPPSSGRPPARVGLTDARRAARLLAAHACRGVRPVGRRRSSPRRRRHGPDGPDHRRARRAARAVARLCGTSTSCAASAGDDGALVIGALTTYTEMRRSPLVREHAARARRGGRDHRRGADPEPRHARRQRRQRLSCRRLLPRAAGAATRELVARQRRAGERPVAARDFWPATGRPRLRPDELLLRDQRPAAGGRQLRFRKVGTRRARRSQGGDGRSPGARTAASGATSAWHSARWRPHRSALRPPRAVLEGAVPAKRPPTGLPRRWPASCTRSTTCAPPPTTGARWRPGAASAPARGRRLVTDPYAGVELRAPSSGGR